VSAKSFQFRQPFAKGWFVAGSAALALLAISIFLRDLANDATPKDWLRWWRYGSGAVLLALFAYQWMLFFARRSDDIALIRKRYRLHKYVGVAMLFLFVAHAGTLGYGVMTAIGAGLVVIAATGLLNAEVLFLSPDALRRARLFIHFAVSAALVPLVILHIWTALAYK
jgi:predicted ferric reductase